MMIDHYKLKTQKSILYSNLEKLTCTKEALG